jgi:Ca2+-binding RTX toxin-like protein
MPGLWGGYSRDTREIYISADCPHENLSAVLIEEIGHFLDQELCLEETPGEEGARFAAAVLGLPLETASQDDALASISLEGHTILVEAAKKSRGSGKSSLKKRGGKRKGSSLNQQGSPGYAVSGSNSGNSRITGGVLYATLESARIVQAAAGDRLIGSRGNDTFVVFTEDVRIEDPNGGIDTVESSATFSLAKHAIIENLVLLGGANINGVGNYKDNFISGNSGSNILESGLGNDTITGGSGNDTLRGDQGADSLLGGEGDDLLDGGLDLFIDTLIGGAGNDTYFVEDTADIIFEDAGGGTDTIVTSNRDITLLTFRNIENIIYIGTPGAGGGERISTLGSAYDDSLFGNSVANTLIGLAGNDTLDAKGGDDSLDGGSGNDLMFGGTGNDTYVVDSPSDFVVEDTNAGTDLVVSAVSYALGENVENLTLNALLAVADANINGTGNALSNILTGNNGNNQLDGGGAADTLTAGAGNDILNGGASDGVGDVLQGGEGNDRYIVDSTLDVIRDSSGTDTVETSVSFDIGDTLRVEGIEHLLYKGSNLNATLRGNNGDNSLVSEGIGNDTLIGGAGNDSLNGGSGANSLAGGAGDDFYIVNSASENIFEDNATGSGLDTVLTKVATFALGADSNVEILTYDPLGTSKTNLTGSNSDNSITGGNFGNSLSGFGGNDYLLGGVQGDTLVGGDGNDTLDGKAGVNSLVGGAGDDYYITDTQSVNLVENLNEGKDTVRSTVTFSLEYSGRLANVEGLYLTGSASLAGTGNSLDNTITGNDGNNAISGKLGNDTILGGLGADYIKGDEGNDSLVGGGDIQGDVPADASTPILLAPGQTYTGQINSKNESDWIKVDLTLGVTYTFAIDSQLNGASVLKERSDIAFGAQGSDQYWGQYGYWEFSGTSWFWVVDDPTYSREPLVGDISRQSQQINNSPWEGSLRDHDELVLNANGTVAYGYFDPASLKKSTKYSNNIVGFQFTPL